jgi:hypothetical protein
LVLFICLSHHLHIHFSFPGSFPFETL